ncbi:UDP-N-acetylmuramate--L-alanine ligase [Anaerolineales bacterium HSG6]|nr:UDP-N-acetylmuramate--L-alanine ligase [Anaerolineales bacterium HSG6]
MSNKIHLIGIGGTGLSAIATVLLQRGYTVSGSDMQASAYTDRLTDMGATIYIGQRAENLQSDLDTVIISSAIPDHNPELQAARQLNLPVVKRAEWLGQMMVGQTGIAVAGTHGKTTTTSMIAYLLEQADEAPTYIIGGVVPQLHGNAKAGTGSAFVIEADEYDHMFLGLRPEIAVLTTLEWDHPDIFPTLADTQQAFTDFIQLVPDHGTIIACGDETGVMAVTESASAPVITYGLTAHNDWQAVDIQPNQSGGHDFVVLYNEDKTSEQGKLAVSLAVPGLHNVANCLATLVVAHKQGLNVRRAVQILGQFQGVERRFQQKGLVNGITVIDDYAHHPTEIKATLHAARTRYPKQRIWAILQPHTFSRTKILLIEFAQAFEHVDQVIVVDIFASREVDDGSISSADILDMMDHPQARHIGPLRDAANYLIDHLQSGDVLITLGAGDGYLVGEWVLAELDA